MFHRYFSTILLLTPILLAQNLFAQRIEDELKKMQENHLLEKISVHTDKSYYLAGDTIWFKAYLMADAFPSMESSKISVSLVNDSNKVVKKIILPVILSTASGSFVLSPQLAGGTYSIQAFTDYMAVRDKTNFYNRSLEIFNISEEKKTKSVPLLPSVNFFPESGKIIEGISNAVAFKITDQFGFPCNGRGVITDSIGTIIYNFESTHNGMGKISLKPIKKEFYRAKIVFDNGMEASFPLPETSSSGLGFESGLGATEIFAEINCSKIVGEEWRPAYLIITQNNFLVARNELPAKEMFRLRIPTNNLETGIAKLTLFSKDDKPLNERIYFINNDEYMLKAEVKVVKKSLQPAAKQTYQLSIADSTLTTLSMAVIDAEYDSSMLTNHIMSDLLITEELRGYVHEPAQYFYKNDMATKQNADLLMMTSGWRRYNWDKIMNGYLPNFPKTKIGYLSFQGNILFKNSKKPVPSANITTILSDKKTMLGMQPLKADELGHFELNNFIAEDTIRIDILSVSDNNGKKLYSENIQLQVTSLPVSAGLTVSPLVTLRNRTTFSIPESRIAFYTQLGFGKEVTLEDLKITARAAFKDRSAINERYTTGTLFNSGELRSYDFLSEGATGSPSQNLFSYATGRFAGITVAQLDGQEVFKFRQNTSLTAGIIPMTIVLDNVQVPAETLKSIPMSDIALVKVYESNLLFSAQSGGILAVFTKRGEDFNNNIAAPKNLRINIEGYSSIKEFYSPDDLDMEKNRINKLPDNRTTIYWNPEIRLSEQQKTVNLSFYNSDKPKKHKVIIQGFNSEGKFYYLEKIIE